MTGHRIIKNLTKRGNSVLGVGVYSAALAATNGVDAIKIGTNIDDPWLDFKALVIDKLPSNNHLPIIKSFYYDNSSEFFVCVMERLDAVNVSSEVSNLVDYCKEYIECYHSSEDFIEYVSNFTKNIPNPLEMLAVLDKIKEHTTHIKYGKPMGVSTSIYDSDDYEPEYEGRMLDMHRGNFMMRNDVLVVIDPWCNVSMDEIQDLSIWADEQISESMQNIF